MSAGGTHYRTRMRARGQVTLPSEVRKMLEADVGDDLVFYVDDQGHVCIQRAQIIPPDQAWFWSERWQQMEREAQADIDSGRVRTFANVDEAIADLELIEDAED